MGKIVKHEACEKCREEGRDRTGDNRAVYADGGYFCFACGDSKSGRVTFKKYCPFCRKHTEHKETK